MTLHGEIANFLVSAFGSKEEIRSFLLHKYDDADDMLSSMSGESLTLFADQAVVALRSRGYLQGHESEHFIGYLLNSRPKRKDEIERLSLRLNEEQVRESAAALATAGRTVSDRGESLVFADVVPPRQDVLKVYQGSEESVPAVEFVPVSRRSVDRALDELPLSEEEKRDVLVHTIHAGNVVPRQVVEDQEVQEWFNGQHQKHMFVDEKDWGANQVAAAIASQLGLDGYLRVNIARSVLDFGRFPGVSPRGADHLQRLSIGTELNSQLDRDKVDELLGLYHSISDAYERAVWLQDGEDSGRPRQIILGVHTYDRHNKEGTLRSPVSLISRSRTYDLNRTMHPGSFDRLFPDELAEFSADRCLLAAIAHDIERERISVSENHPYSMPDGCVEVRSQVWYYFKYLQHRFRETQEKIVNSPSSGLSEADFQSVWSMLLDTTMRQTESSALRSYLHRHRISASLDRGDRFRRCRMAYEEISRFAARRSNPKNGVPDIVNDYRLSERRPSSLGLEVRKDLVWRFNDPSDRLSSRRQGWKMPIKEPQAAIEENIDRIAKLVARGIARYLRIDRPAKAEAEDLYDQLAV